MQHKDFEEMLEPHYADAVRFSHSMAGGSVEGDDLLQESLIRAWRGFRKLRDHTVFKPWLLRIISNTYRSMQRRAWIRNMLTLDHAEAVLNPESLSYEDRDLVRLALQKLPRIQREAVTLYEVIGLKIEEIAAIQNCTPAAAKSRVGRGRQKLRERYAELYDPEESNEQQIAQTY